MDRTNNKTLSGRFIEYEQVTNNVLMKRQPIIIRLDGRRFSKFTKNLDKPFDEIFYKCMKQTCEKLTSIDSVKLIYSQSDEISLLIYSAELNKDTWYDNRIQKLVSSTASLVTAYFNEAINEVIKSRKLRGEKLEIWKSKLFKATFDSRAFNIPIDDTANYFIYRQQDAIRNSKMSFARSYYSHPILNGISCDDAINKVKNEHSVDWYDLPTYQKRGFCIYKNNKEDNTRWTLDEDIPMFIADRQYIEKYLFN